jgi:hypothetical protein
MALVTILDWTPRKRPASSLSPSTAVPDEASLGIAVPEVEEIETPFSFLKRKNCRQTCCTARVAPLDGRTEFLNFTEALAIFFIPPPLDTDWISGCVVNVINNGSDIDSFMESTTSTQNNSQLSILAHEVEIDDCLRCAERGYQRFR